MASKAEYLLVLNTLFFVLPWVSVSLRIYVRAKIIRTWGLDDWLVLSSQLMFTVLFALNLMQISYGAGKHISDIGEADYRKALLVLSHNEMTTDMHQTIGKANVSIRYWWLCDIFYTICCSMLKLSIGFLILRFTVQRIYIFLLHQLMWGTFVIGLAYAFFIVFHCKPVSDFWTLEKHGCVNPSIWLAVSYTASALSAFADWVYGILPIFVIWNLQLSNSTKAIVAGVLGFGAIGSVATVIRTFYIHTLNDPDFEWATAELTILSNIEVGVGITATCLATLRPLLRIVSDRYKGYQSSHTNRDELNTGGARPLWPSCIMEAERDSSQAHNLSKIRKVVFLPPQYRGKNINSMKAIGQGRYQKNNALAYDAAYFEMV